MTEILTWVIISWFKNKQNENIMFCMDSITSLYRTKNYLYKMKQFFAVIASEAMTDVGLFAFHKLKLSII